VPAPPLIVYVVDDDAAIRQALTRLMRAAGAAAFFRKPVDGEALLDAITWAVESVVDGAGGG
jgi:FixJ family two-component response regulator